MPRFSSGGSSSTIKTPTSSPPDYFTSLDALRTYSSTPRRIDRYTVPLIPYDTTRNDDAGNGKMTVCHDYKVLLRLSPHCWDKGRAGYFATDVDDDRFHREATVKMQVLEGIRFSGGI